MNSFKLLKKVRERERLIDKEEQKKEDQVLNALSQDLKEKYLRLKYKGEIVSNDKPNGKFK